MRSFFRDTLTIEEINASWLPEIDQTIGLQITEIGTNSLAGEFTVHQGIVQPHGILHGGVSCLVGESLGSIAGSLCLQDMSQVVVGQNLQALHLRPARLGLALIARTEALHVGRKSQIWETQIKEKISGKMIAQITLTLAVIERA